MVILVLPKCRVLPLNSINPVDIYPIAFMYLMNRLIDQSTTAIQTTKPSRKSEGLINLGSICISLFQILIKKIDGAFPGQFCSGFIITGRSIVMEAVVHVIINKCLVFFAVRF